MSEAPRHGLQVYVLGATDDPVTVCGKTGGPIVLDIRRHANPPGQAP